MIVLYKIFCVIYFLLITWFASLFPRIIIISFLAVTNLFSSNFISIIDKVIFVISAFAIGVKVRYEINKLLIPPFTYNLTPLFEIEPKIEQEINCIIESLKIKKHIDFFVCEFGEYISFADSNINYAIVVIRKDLYEYIGSNKNELIAVIGHELAHVKYRSIYFINYQLELAYEIAYSRFKNLNNSANKKWICRLLNINELTRVWELCVVAFLFMMYMVSNTYSSFVNEVIADKFSVDCTKGTYLANLLERVDTRTSLDFEILSHDHLPTIIRCALIRRYYNWKYNKPNFKRNCLFIIIISSIAVSFLYWLINLLYRYVLLILEDCFEYIKQMWLSTFGNNIHLSMIALFDFFVLIGVTWSVLQFRKSLINNNSLAERLKRLNIIFFFFLMASSNCILFSSLSNYHIMSIIPLCFLFIFTITYYSSRFLEKREKKIEKNSEI